jgi:RNA polymerase sigma-70 factor (ECF subfamily)
MKLFARLHTYREMDGIPFEHWVSRVTVRTCLDRLRSERREPAGALSAGASEWLLSLRTDGAAPAHDVLAARELVSALLGTLPPRDRLLLTLLDLEDRSVAEVARITGYGTTLVKVRAFRARRRLRAAALALGAAPGGAS